jgi:hypothetical protein
VSHTSRVSLATYQSSNWMTTAKVAPRVAVILAPQQSAVVSPVFHPTASVRSFK